LSREKTSQFVLFLSTFLTLLFCTAPTNASTRTLQQQVVSDILQQRNVIFSTLITSPGQSIEAATLEKIPQKDRSSPWYLLLKAGSSKVSAQDELIHRAMQKCQNSESALMVFIVTLNQYEGFQSHAQEAAYHLRKMLIARGADNHYLVRNMLWDHCIAYQDKSSWISLLNILAPQAIEKYLLKLRYDPMSMRSSVMSLLPLVAQDGFYSIHLLGIGAELLGYWLLFLTFLIFLKPMLLHLPRALHTLAERLPRQISLSYRLILVFIPMLALGFADIVVVLWILFLFLWPHCKNNRRILLFVALLLYQVSSMCFHLHYSIVHNAMPNSPIGTLQRTINSGEQSSLQAHDPYVYLSRAYSALYQNNMDGLAQNVIQYTKFKGVDRQSAVLQSWYHIGQNNRPKAIGLLKSMSEASNNPIDLYNYAQVQIETENSAQGVQNLKKAISQAPERIGEFIRENDAYFQSPWPLHRLLIAPAIPFSDLLQANLRSFNWVTQIGFSLISLGIVLLLAFLLQKYYWSNAQIRRRLGICGVCRNPICRDCSTNGICASCYQELETSSDKINQRHKIQMRVRASKMNKFTLIDAVLPGSSLKSFWAWFAGIFSTAAYAVFLTTATQSSAKASFSYHQYFQPVYITFLILVFLWIFLSIQTVLRKSHT